MGNSHIKLSDWIFEENDTLVAPDAIISYWKMDEASGNCVDSVGSYDLTEQGTVPSSAGLFTNCRGEFSAINYFEGIDTYSDPNFDVSEGSTFAYEGFFKPNNSINDEQTIFQTTGDSTYLSYDYDKTEGWSVVTYGYDTGNFELNNSSLSPVPTYEDSWTHFMVAKLGDDQVGGFLLFINGELVDSGTSEGYTYIRDNIFIGKKERGADNPCSGIKLCDMAWWYNLSADRVGGADIQSQLLSICQQRYNAGAGKQYTIS